MWPDRVSNPGPLTYESGALPTALCGPANFAHDNVSQIRTISLAQRSRSVLKLFS